MFCVFLKEREIDIYFSVVDFLEQLLIRYVGEVKQKYLNLSHLYLIKEKIIFDLEKKGN